MSGWVCFNWHGLFPLDLLIFCLDVLTPQAHGSILDHAGICLSPLASIFSQIASQCEMPQSDPHSIFLHSEVQVVHHYSICTDSFMHRQRSDSIHVHQHANVQGPFFKNHTPTFLILLRVKLYFWRKLFNSSRCSEDPCYIPSRGRMTGCRPVVRKPVTGRKYRTIR
jgi:hypothetical protein